jgi:bifunctional ADP-heptose synthase (sugar kinase/adenylyltransferase)
MLRLDAEITRELEVADEERLVSAVARFIENESPQVMIFEDYNKGVLTPEVISKVIELCNQKNIPTTVDPKRKLLRLS